MNENRIKWYGEKDTTQTIMYQNIDTDNVDSNVIEQKGQKTGNSGG